MEFTIERIMLQNYPQFDDMCYWRATGTERVKSDTPVCDAVKKELADPNFALYAAKADGRYVGWIALAYIPKVSRLKGHGHVYVDELWVQDDYRRNGIAKALLQKADEQVKIWDAVGVRLYVNTENPNAKALYEQMGFAGEETAYFMEK